MSVSLGRAAAIAAVVTAVCFLIAGAVGQNQDGWLGDTLPQWLGNIAWFGLLIGGLLTVLLALTLLVRRMTGRAPQGGDPAAT